MALSTRLKFSVIFPTNLNLSIYLSISFCLFLSTPVYSSLSLSLSLSFSLSFSALTSLFLTSFISLSLSLSYSLSLCLSLAPSFSLFKVLISLSFSILIQFISIYLSITDRSTFSIFFFLHLLIESVIICIHKITHLHETKTHAPTKH